jgi:hypothetical protein
MRDLIVERRLGKPVQINTWNYHNKPSIKLAILPPLFAKNWG